MSYEELAAYLAAGSPTIMALVSSANAAGIVVEAGALDQGPLRLLQHCREIGIETPEQLDDVIALSNVDAPAIFAKRVADTPAKYLVPHSPQLLAVIVLVHT